MTNCIEMRLTSEPPITHDLNSGYSLGLEYPYIWGWRPDRQAWMIWHRRTGGVLAVVRGQDADREGWIGGEGWIGRMLCQRIAELQTVTEWVDQDSVP